MSLLPHAAAFDIDGTLAESKQALQPGMALLLQQLLQKMPVAVLSGASFVQFQNQLLAHLPSDTTVAQLYLFPVNAAQCYTFAGGAWESNYDFNFTDEEKAEITGAITEALTEIHFETPPQVWGEQIEDRAAQISFSPLGQQAPLDVKKEWRATHDGQRSLLRTALAQKLPNFSVQTGGETTIDITRKAVTKSYGLHKFAELCGVAIADMVYVGDALMEGGNDSIVIETGVPTHAVKDPTETATFITLLLS